MTGLLVLYEVWGQFAEERRNYAVSYQALSDALEVRSELQEDDHWQVIDARLRVRHVGQIRDLSDAQRQDYFAAVSAMEEARGLRGDQKKKEEMITLLRRCAEKIKKTVGEEHHFFIATKYHLGVAHFDNGEFEPAEAYGKEALEMMSKLKGTNHPDYGEYLEHLATVYEKQVRFDDAERAFLGAYRIAFNVWQGDAIGSGVRNRIRQQYGTASSNLGQFYLVTGKLAEAERHLREAVKQLQGNAVSYSGSLHNLGTLLAGIGDFGQAEEILQEACSLTLQEVGETPDYAMSLNSLGLLYVSMNRLDDAEQRIREGLDILSRHLPGKITQYASTANSLALLEIMSGRPDQAERVIRSALSHFDESSRTPVQAILLRHLGQVVSDEQEASRHAHRSLQMMAQTLGEQHILYGQNLCAFALRGDGPDPRAMFKMGLGIIRRNLDLASMSQSERQQLAMAVEYRKSLDLFLEHSEALKFTPEQTYQEVCVWKGAVLARKRLERTLRRLNNRDVSRLVQELEQVVGRLSRLTLNQQHQVGPETALEISTLSLEKENLEKQILNESPLVGQALSRSRIQKGAIKDSLPDECVLVDFLEFQEHSDLVPGDRRLIAFVSHSDETVVRVDLGESLKIESAVRDWRQAFAAPRSGDRTSDTAYSDTQRTEIEQSLRKLVWDPLIPHLKEKRLVLVSPDGPVSAVPFAAIRDADGKYLIETTSFVTMPVPQLLPELITNQPPNYASPRLLVVGDVDYGNKEEPQDPKPIDQRLAATRGGLEFRRLSGSKDEIRAVRNSFMQAFPTGQVQLLEGRDATETSLIQQASRHEYLHLVTHGFFAPADLTSALGRPRATLGIARFDGSTSFGHHPGVLSGLALSGANVPLEQRAASEDGIITALEVAELDLEGCRLVVLSACETGLGEVAGGEGILGLQRSFQVAGSDSVVSSLWEVDTVVTTALMENFYSNLWVRKLPLYEALRAAQLAVLQGEFKELGQTSSPRYWAAWTLSGSHR